MNAGIHPLSQTLLHRLGGAAARRAADAGLVLAARRVFPIELEATFIVAVLTVIGFSVHDRIVTFDRVRENTARHAGEPFEDVVNHSLTQTIVRSLITSVTVVLTLLVLLLFGGSTIRTFGLALLIGMAVGTYSSIFVASMLLVSWHLGELRWLGPRPARGESSLPAPRRPLAEPVSVRSAAPLEAIT